MNRQFALSGTSQGHVSGDFDTNTGDSIFTRMTAKGVDWRVLYFVRRERGCQTVQSLASVGCACCAVLAQALGTIEHQELPSVCFVLFAGSPSFSRLGLALQDSEVSVDVPRRKHVPCLRVHRAALQLARQRHASAARCAPRRFTRGWSACFARCVYVAQLWFVAAIYNNIRANKALWESTLFVITFDEHGGFFDHVMSTRTICVLKSDVQTTGAAARCGCAR